MRSGNVGVGGERTDEIRQRLDRAVTDGEVVVVQGGINDVVQRRSINLAIDDLQVMIERVGEIATAVLLANMLSWSNG